MSRSRAERAWIITAAVVGAAVIVLVVTLIAGGPSPATRYGERGSTDQRSSGPAGRPVRRFGQTVRLKTYLTIVEVRPLAFVPFAASESSGAGVGVDVAIRNVGDAGYRDQPAQAASVKLRNGGEAERVYGAVGECAGPSEDTISIPPGASRRFCLPFEAAGRADLFVYAPEAGLPNSRGAPEAAAWGFSG